MEIITDHARKRIRKRIGTKAAQKSYEDALADGIHMRDAKGELRRYLCASAMKHQSDAIVYKGYVYWHKNRILITVIALPQKYLKYTKPKKDK